MKKAILCIIILLVSIDSNVFSQEEKTIDKILEKSMKAAEVYSEIVEEYDANIYMRIYVETLKKNLLYRYTHLIPQFVLHNRYEDEGVIEVLSDLKFNFPNNYTADVKHISGTFSQKDVIDILPSNLIHLNVYNKTSSNEKFIMPLRESSKKYYRYELKRTYREGGKTYYTISFTPIYKSSKLLKGSFILEKDSWYVIQFICEGTDFLSEFSVELKMGNIGTTKTLPVSAVVYQKHSYLGNVVTNRNLVNISYKNIQLNENRPKEKNLNISNLYKVRLDSVPVEDNPVFWEINRKIPLQAKEKDLINKFQLDQSLKYKKNREQNVDSLDKKENKAMEWAKNVVLDSRYKYKNTNIRYGGLLNPALIGYSSVDGLTYKQKLNINFELARQTSLEMSGFVGYMFKNKELFTNFSTVWNYNPRHLGKLSLSVGNGNKTYSSMFLEEVQDSLLNSGLKVDNLTFTYYKNYYFRLFNTVEISNGFSITTGLEYQLRDATDNKIDSQTTPLLSSGNSGSADLSNLFKRQKVFAPTISLTWTPEQYYRLEGRQKIYVRSPYPTMTFEFSKGFKGVFGSTSVYNRIELDISQKIQLGLMKSFNYHIGMGFFSNQKSEYFTDFEYFAKQNFPDRWSDGIGGVFNLLDRRFYNASDTYLQNHFMYEAPFMILDLLPILSKGFASERLYLSHLYNPYIESYTELGYGIGNKYLNAAIFGSFHKLKFHEIGFKISLDMF